MGSIRSKDIRGEALAMELQRRGVNPMEASIEIGAATGYIKDAIRRNRINNYAISALKQRYNIIPEMYLNIETPEAVHISEGEIPVIDYDRLYEVIRKAIKDAMDG